jgi:hypothetical protein
MAPFGIDAAEDVAHDESQFAQTGERGGAVSWGAQVSWGCGRVGERLPVFELLVAVEELDGDEGIALFETDRPALIQAVKFVDD